MIKKKYDEISILFMNKSVLHLKLRFNGVFNTFFCINLTQTQQFKSLLKENLC